MSQIPFPAGTHIGQVALTVSDLDRSLHFYSGVLGFQVLSQSEATATLAADGRTPLLELAELPGALPRPRRTSGLYHFAILTPSRGDLARSLRQLIQVDWPIQGHADHGVSEALYLADPDGNGIEIYADRPRERWTWHESQVAMVTDPLNVKSLLEELDRDPQPWQGLAPETVIGHVHLHVAGLAQAEAFYCDLLGFEVMQRSYPGALFVAAGGYHHHIGLNIWAGRGAPPPPADAVGLRFFSIVLPDWPALNSVIARIEASRLDLRAEENGWLLHDPAGNGVMLRSLAGMTNHRIGSSS